MAATVQCTRCGRPEAPALARQPLPGPRGAEIREKICADCWNEWQKMEVMVINELRLNFMDLRRSGDPQPPHAGFPVPGWGQDREPIAPEPVGHPLHARNPEALWKKRT